MVRAALAFLSLESDLSAREVLGVCSCACGLLLAGAEAETLGWQIASGIVGLAMFAAPIWIAKRSERQN